MASLLHKLKREIAGIGHTTHDKDYDEAKKRFDHLVDHTNLFKQRLGKLMQTIKDVNVANADIDGLLSTFIPKESPSSNPHVAFSAEVKKGAAALAKHEDQTQKQISATAHKRIADLQRAYEELSKRIKVRDEARKEYDYYVQKVNKLHEDKAKLTAAGKPESQSDADKRDKDEKKLDAATRSYNEVHEALMRDLKRVWDDRFDLVGPVVAEIFAAQRGFSNGYAQILGEMKVPNVEPSAPLEFTKSAPSSSGSQSPTNASAASASPPMTQPAATASK